MDEEYLKAYTNVLQWLKNVEDFFESLIDICDKEMQENETDRLETTQANARLIKELQVVTSACNNAKNEYENALDFNNEYSSIERSHKLTNAFVTANYKSMHKNDMIS